MPGTKSESHSNYTPQQLMSLILDVESYPEFIPWCQAARVIERSEDLMVADMIIFFKAFTETYRSKIEIFQNNDGSININVQAINGPFEYLINNWLLIPHPEGSIIQFMVDFSFKSLILNKLMGTYFEKATVAIVDSFEQRAKYLFELKS